MNKSLAPLARSGLARRDDRYMRRVDRQSSVELYVHDRLTDIVLAMGANIDDVTRARVIGGERLVARAEQALASHPNGLMAEVIERAMRKRERAHDRLADLIER